MRLQMMSLSQSRVISYSEYGDCDGQPVFVLHGTPGSRFLAEVFDKTAQDIHLRIIAPDRPGYGLSTPRRYRLLDYPADILEMADRLNLGTFAIVGVSGGTASALACAYNLPQQRVTMVGLVGTIGPMNEHDVSGEMIAMNRFMMCQIGRYTPSIAAILLQTMTRLSLFSVRKHLTNGTSPSPEMPPALFALMMRYSEEAFRSGFAGTAYDFRNLWQPWGFDLADVQIPVALWHGEADNLAPASMAHYLLQHLPNATATFYAGEDHLQPVLNHTAEILAAVRQSFQPQLMLD